MRYTAITKDGGLHLTIEIGGNTYLLEDRKAPSGYRNGQAVEYSGEFELNVAVQPPRQVQEKPGLYKKECRSATERVAVWRNANRERYNAHMRDYMRKRRGA